MFDGNLWVVEMLAGDGIWWPYKMYLERMKAETKVKRLKEFQSESEWRMRQYVRIEPPANEIIYSSCTCGNRHVCGRPN